VKVLVAGASGVLGRHIARALTGAGHDVVGLGRGPDNDLRADLLDRDAVLRAVDGLTCDAVVHAATALKKPPIRHRDMAATNRLRTSGTAHLIEAAHTIGARRFIAETMIFGYGYGDFGQALLTENDVFAPPGTTPPLERHLAAMRVKERLAFAASGIDGIALRYGLLYGAGATDPLVAMLRKRLVPAPADGRRVLPWVNLTDAASATVAALERGRVGAAYNVVDDAPLSMGAHIRAIAAAFGTPKPMTVPSWMMRALPYAYAALTTNMRVSNAKAKTELSWKPAYPTSADGLRALADTPVD
jgi:nucleoside-diphosphate-sugar epimerase